MAQGSPVCPRYHHAVELLGRRWAGAIIRLLLTGPSRYNELRARIPDISDRMLAERLKELELEGVVVRTVLPEAPIGVEYCLTEKGKALEAPVMAIGKWAEKWLAAPVHSKVSPASAKLSGSRRR
jgi:DNA-binding HxlR family transcriptional regulator